jgi:hypothetical protein
VRHPEWGALKLNTWKTRLALDDRFLVVYVAPADAATAVVLDSWLGSDRAGDSPMSAPARS